MEREYPIPGYEKYFATENGDNISHKGNGKTLMAMMSTGTTHLLLTLLSWLMSWVMFR